MSHSRWLWVGAILVALTVFQQTEGEARGRHIASRTATVVEAQFPSGVYYNLRAAPALSAPVIGFVHSGDLMAVMGTAAGQFVDGSAIWLHVRLAGMPTTEGYLIASALPRSALPLPWVAQVIGPSVTQVISASAQPTASAQTYATYGAGTRLTVLQRVVRGRAIWYRVQTAGQAPAYMQSASLQFVGLGRTSLPQPAVTAAAYWGEDLSTGRMLVNHGGDEKRSIASLTKLMTVLIALETTPLTTTFVAPAGLSAVTTDIGGSSMGLQEGNVLTLHDLLYGMLLPSGNDAAVTVADGIAGSVPAFVAMMNRRARALGLQHTHYTTPDGLDDDGQYSSAHDLAVVVHAVLRFPIVDQIVGTHSYMITATAAHPSFTLLNTNALLGVYPGVFGVKTGTTPAAGECLIAAIHARGHNLVLILLGSSHRYRDAVPLLDYLRAIDSQPHAA